MKYRCPINEEIVGDRCNHFDHGWCRLVSARCQAEPVEENCVEEEQDGEKN
jgi:hypothetical protein